MGSIRGQTSPLRATDGPGQAVWDPDLVFCLRTELLDVEPGGPSRRTLLWMDGRVRNKRLL